MANARKSADDAPAEGAPDAVVPDAQPQAPVAEEAAAQEAPVAPVEDLRPAETLVFLGQAEMFVTGVGLCVPGESYPMSAAVADQVCRGEQPLFARPAAS